MATVLNSLDNLAYRIQILEHQVFHRAEAQAEVKDEPAELLREVHARAR